MHGALLSSRHSILVLHLGDLEIFAAGGRESDDPGCGGFSAKDVGGLPTEVAREGQLVSVGDLERGETGARADATNESEFGEGQVLSPDVAPSVHH